LDFSFLPLGQRFTEAKRCLAIAVKRGALVKEFRRHGVLKQDKEYYLVHAANCPFDCSYCYLQSYFSNAVPTLFVDTDSLLDQVGSVVGETPEKEILFHAGETADALALEHISEFAVEAVAFFSKLERAILELRTKSDLIEPLLPLQHNGRTAVSWTLTPEDISGKYERGTASISERLQAALRCQGVGYRIGLRFDPMIHYAGWRAGYKELIDSVANILSPEKIDSIVLGTFRCPPSLVDIMRERFGRNELVLGELVPGPDGKVRYFRHLRQEMYREMLRMFRERCGSSIIQKIEFSMEPDYIWKGAGLS
jgi:spore photoproduct lyase